MVRVGSSNNSSNMFDNRSTVGSSVSDKGPAIVNQYYELIQTCKQPKQNTVFELPKELNQLLMETDALTDKSTDRLFRKQFKIFSAILQTILRKNSQVKRVNGSKSEADRRINSDSGKRSAADDVASDDYAFGKRQRRSSSCSNESFVGENVSKLAVTDSKMSKHEATIYEKVKTRQSMLPEEMYKCKSLAALLVTALFCLHDYRKDIIVKTIVDIYKNKSKKYRNVSDVVELSSKPLGTIAEMFRSTDVNEYKQFDVEFKKCLSVTIMDLCELLCDKNLSYTLMALDYDLYVETAVAATAKKVYKSMFPFHAAVTEYIKKCIALCESKKKNKEILEQFEVNPQETLMLILSNLKSMRESELKSTQQVTDTRKVYFDPETTYNVFRGTPHFETHVSVTCKVINDDVYQIKSYKNCVFDVIGTQKQGLFHDKTWLERLKTVNITPKVVVEEVSGSELNNIAGNAYLGVSWMESDGSTYKTFNIQKKHKK